MPIPSYKIYLSTALAAGRAVRILPTTPGDFAPLVPGAPAVPWLSAVSDINGDGRPDVIIGASADSDKLPGAGRIFVQYGALVGGASLSMGDSLTEMIIDGVNAGDHAGAAVGSIADLNGDAKGEILIGAPGMENGALTDAGAAFVVFGKSTGGVDLNDPFTANGGGYVIKGQAAGDAAGTTIMSIADLNGDGKADVIVGAPGQDAGGSNAGAVYVVWGKSDGNIVNLSAVAAGTGGFKIVGAAANDAAGAVIGVATDMNGDGKSEILIGTPEAGLPGAHAGAVYVVFGQGTGATVNLSAIGAGTGGFVINGAAGDNAGAAVSGIGDVNGDGVGDILIGAPRADHAYVVFGKASTTAVNLADVANGIGGFQILAEHAGDLSQLSLAGGADLNHDGVNDLVIGTPGANEGGLNAGAVYLVWGGGHSTVDLAAISQSMGGAKIVGAAGSLTGASVAISPDLNADGNRDLLIGAPGAGESVYVLYGDASWQPDINVYGTNGADVIGAGYGASHVVGDGADNIFGLAGDDVINAAGGDDIIDGGAGADAMSGGAGNDTYYVDNTLDVVNENADDGIDTIVASVNYTLSANVENLTLSVPGLTGTGNALANSITGTAGADTIDGGAGADVMTGGAGNDRYVVDNAGDIVVEALNGGVDSVTSSIDYTLGANVERLTLTGAARFGTGNDLNNILIGTSGNDTLDGGVGADTMNGGAGNDSYVVDNLGDVVVEAANIGVDTVTATVDGYTLAANVENLTLSGAAHRGTGNAGANALTGGAGDDVLDGGAGIDTLIGGAGNDTYVVDSTTDTIVEAVGGGTDTVLSSVDYTLADGSNVENLTLTGAAHHGVGNGDANVLTGGAGDDVLDGGAGIDTLIGGAGNDTYVVDSTTDTIVEAVGGGTDTVLSSVDYTLADGSNVENLTLTGAARHAVGNSGDNILTGGAGDDLLDGGMGDDTLIGGAGVDTMIGGAGNDTYYIDNPGDIVVETATGGVDTVIVNSDWTLADNIENVTLVGTGHILTGNAADNTLKGDTGNDTLDGGGGNDTELGGDGNDTLVSNSGHDILAGGAGDDVYKINGGSAHIEDFQGHDTIDASSGTVNQRIDLSGDTKTEIEKQICDFGTGGTITGALNVQFMQDLTGSFADDIANVRTLVPQIVTALNSVSGGAAFGVSSFRDKPYGAFGGAGDYVYQTGLAVGASASALTAAYTGFVATGGADLPEAQLEALLQLGVRASGEVKFQNNSARFAVLFTDASFHTAADGTAAGITTPNNGDAIINNGGIMENYPVIAQVKAALEAANIIPIFAIAGGFETTYQGLVNDLGRGTVVTLTANSSNIVSAITTGLASATTTHIADALAGSGDDALIGNVGANKLDGGAGDDTLEGRQGDDILIGGAGVDTAIYSGAFADHTITLNADGTTTVADNRVSGGDGVDTLSGIEFLRFGGAVYTIAGGAVPPTLAPDTLTGLVEAGFGVAGNATGAGNVLTNDVIASLPASVSGAYAGLAGAMTAVTGATVLTGVYGDLTINPDGSFSYALDNARAATDALKTGDTATDVFTYQVIDSGGLNAETQLSVTIAGSNDLPPTVVTTSADKLLITAVQPSQLDASVLLANDSVTNGESLTVTGVSNAVGGAVALTAGKLVITAVGAGGFDYTATSSGGVAANGHVTFATVATSALADKVAAGSAYAAADLVGQDGNDILAGGPRSDRLDGGAGNDVLSGGAGADLMIGGLGNDSFVVDNLGDVVVEAAGEGADKVTTSLLAYTLADNVETLVGTGAGAYNFTGNAGANTIYGGAGDDTLAGLDGNDLLNGGAGADRMVGGLANDSYVVDNAGDVVVEAAGEGVDRVTTSLLTYTLADNVEILAGNGAGSYNFTGNALGNTITGGAGDDTLAGLDGNDTLNGSAGADLMIGGLGNDLFIVDNAGDAIVENAGEGVDSVYSSLSLLLPANVENLTLTGTANIDGTGNALNNILTGNSGANILDGGSGDDRLNGGAGTDRLTGGAGNDTLTGGAGADVFIFSAAGAANGLDRVTDFESGVDALSFTASDYGFAAGHVLSVNEFTAGTSAVGAAAQFIWNAATHTLSWDSDGAGAAAATRIAVFQATASVVATDLRF